MLGFAALIERQCSRGIAGGNPTSVPMSASKSASKPMQRSQQLAASRGWLTFAALLVVAWAAAAGVLLAERWPEMGQRLFDGDDAMRLVEVRDFLAGRGWFDLHEVRLDPPAGYDTHWSRLIDAGLAGLFVAFRSFAAPDLAEALMRAAWPLIWLLAAMGAVAALAWRIAGRNAALAALVVCACALPAFQHFKPGRIDHHNVQIALALAVAAAAAWSDRARHAAALAGALTGLAAAVGLEGLPYLATGGAALVLRFASGGPGDATDAPASEPAARALAAYGLALAASMLLGFLVSVAPAQWGRSACDAIAVNWLLAAGGGGLGLALAARALRRSAAGARLVAVGLVGAAAGLAFVLAEPRCIHGPFAMTDAAVKAIWLDQVDEMEPLIGFVRGFPLLGAWLCSFPLVGLLALLWLARDTRRDFGFLVAAAAFLVSVAATFGAEKVYSYAMWFAMPPVAALASRLIASAGWRAGLARFAAALVLTPTSVTAAALTVVQTVAEPSPAKPGMAERAACTRNDAYAPLARLPAGLVATDINYGPYVLALTPHAVVAAPYHRVVGGMLAAQAILAGPLDAARRAVAADRVTYLAICGHRTSTGAVPAVGTLWAELDAGRVPSWLEPAPGSEDGQFRVYRVRRD
jgi:hypothetical protein